MACFLIHKQDTTVTIPQVETVANVTYYVIRVKVGPVHWTVKQRYNCFLELHETLVSDHSVPKDMLPPKKLIGNKDPAFIEERRMGLQSYLSVVITFLQQRMPRELVVFLDFHLYEVLFLLQEFSSFLFREAEILLQASRRYVFTPLNLYAISERLKQPCPPLELINKSDDFSHVLEFCGQLQCIKVEGSEISYRTSNIIPNQLQFELAPFKLVETLIIIRANLANLYGLGTMRSTVTSLTVKQCRVQSLGEVLLCDEVHKTVDNISEEKAWHRLVEADFSQNCIKETDDVLLLMPNLKRLIIAENEITEVKDMSKLPKLTHLSLSANRITELGDLSSRLKNIIYLDLSQNKISSLSGFQNLEILEGLDVGSNCILELSEIRYVNILTRLDYLNLTGNPVTTVVDYRIRVLEQFGARAAHLCLDNERPNQKELDTVSVLQALRIVKEGRTPTFDIVPPFPNTGS